ncbi:uncharacterized protein LOC110707465 [Chenopodium quinoa]|uniref:uncharacterized protein LOC110707465 n=1 Tax=Chenopodium quinoa TaxID=63459 RepID=UPI000B795C4F|nr:uncharacterized protein LOC110707465 [Chenopodium quinoa]
MKGDIAIGKIGRSRSHAIDNVFLVEGLKHNLLSISQFCDKGNSVSFTSNKCRIIHNDTGDIILEGTRKGNTYVVDLNEVPNNSLTCLSVIEDDPLLWHKRFDHASFSLLDKLRSKNLVKDFLALSSCMIKCVKLVLKVNRPEFPSSPKRWIVMMISRLDLYVSKIHLRNQYHCKKQPFETAEVTNPEANVQPELENAPGTQLQEQIENHNEGQNVETPEEVQPEFQNQVPIEEPVNNNEERMYPIKDFTPRPWKYQKSHPVDTIMCDITKGTQTRSQLRIFCAFNAFLSSMEPKNYVEALTEADWINVMQAELNEFERYKFWHLEPRLKDKKSIGLKWVFRNKLDVHGIIVMNKARLVVQGFNQQEGVDYEETFAPVARWMSNVHS